MVTTVKAIRMEWGWGVKNIDMLIYNSKVVKKPIFNSGAIQESNIRIIECVED